MKYNIFFYHILILLLVKCEFSRGSSSSINPQECGRRISEIRGDKSNKILGGNRADPEDWGWQTMLKAQNSPMFPGRGYQFICGGSLINSEWVITAAHCFWDGVKPEDLELEFGLHSRSRPESDSTKRAVSKIIIHPDWNETLRINDIALLKLTEPVRYTNHILPICLPELNSDFSDQVAWVTGWGNTREGMENSVSDYLKEATIMIYSDSKCKDLYDKAIVEIWKFNYTNTICAFDEKNNTCMGDSGGPLVVKVGDKWQLAGITSWGYCAMNGASHQSAYAKTSFFVEWIRGETTSVDPKPSVDETTSVGPKPSVDETTSVGPKPSVDETTSVGPKPSVDETTSVGPKPSVDETTSVGPKSSLNPTQSVGIGATVDLGGQASTAVSFSISRFDFRLEKLILFSLTVFFFNLILN